MEFKTLQLKMALTEMTIDVMRLKRGDDSEQLIADYTERIVKLLATPAVSVELPLTEARLSALHDIAKQYCYTTQDDSPTISRKGVELLLVEYSKGN
jgi:hypothetical protein